MASNKHDDGDEIRQVPSEVRKIEERLHSSKPDDAPQASSKSKRKGKGKARANNPSLPYPDAAEEKPGWSDAASPWPKNLEDKQYKHRAASPIPSEDDTPAASRSRQPRAEVLFGEVEAQEPDEDEADGLRDNVEARLAARAERLAERRPREPSSSKHKSSHRKSRSDDDKKSRDRADTGSSQEKTKRDHGESRRADERPKKERRDRAGDRADVDASKSGRARRPRETNQGEDSIPVPDGKQKTDTEDAVAGDPARKHRHRRHHSKKTSGRTVGTDQDVGASSGAEDRPLKRESGSKHRRHRQKPIEQEEAPSGCCVIL